MEELKELLLTYKEKFALPLDAVVTTTYNNIPTIKNTSKQIDIFILRFKFIFLTQIFSLS